MKKYVLTGGPGIGKTTIIGIFASRGYATLPETARLVIEEQKASNGTVFPWTDVEKFQREVAIRQMVHEKNADTGAANQIFLDRSVIDGYGYCALAGVPTPDIIENHGRSRYDKIFVLEPLPFYETDSSRLEDASEAVKIHAAIADAYGHFGYASIRVPVGPAEERADYILKHL